MSIEREQLNKLLEFMLAFVTLHQEEIMFLHLFKRTKHLQLALIHLIISGIGVQVCF